MTKTQLLDLASPFLKVEKKEFVLVNIHLNLIKYIYLPLNKFWCLQVFKRFLFMWC